MNAHLTVQLLSGDMMTVPIDIQDTYLDLYHSIRDALPGDVWTHQLHLMDGEGELVPITTEPVQLDLEKTYHLLVDPFRYSLHLVRRYRRPFACVRGYPHGRIGKTFSLVIKRFGFGEENKEERIIEEWVLYHQADQTYQDLDGIPIHSHILPGLAISVSPLYQEKPRRTREEIVEYYIARLHVLGVSLAALRFFRRELVNELTAYETLCPRLTGDEQDEDDEDDEDE